jgi:hypothetical protein
MSLLFSDLKLSEKKVLSAAEKAGITNKRETSEMIEKFKNLGLIK